MLPHNKFRDLFENDNSIIYAPYNVPLRNYYPHGEFLTSYFWQILKDHISKVNPSLNELLNSSDLFFRVCFRGGDPVDENIPNSLDEDAVNSILECGVEYRPNGEHIGYTYANIWQNYLLPGDDIELLLKYPFSYIMIYQDKEGEIFKRDEYSTPKLSGGELRSKLKGVIRLFWWPIEWDDYLDMKVPKDFGIPLNEVVRPPDYNRDWSRFLESCKKLDIHKEI